MQRTNDGFAGVKRYFCGNTVYGSRHNGSFPQTAMYPLILQMIRIGISVGEAEQGIDAFRGRGVAAKKTHWVILERGAG